MKYLVIPSLSEDINSGWCWIDTPTIDKRCVVKIENLSNGKNVTCEVLSIDDNFRRKYKKQNIFGEHKTLPNDTPLILMNHWYRSKLGIILESKNSDKANNDHQDLDISLVSKYNIIDKVKSCLAHPQISVRISSWLGLAGAALGTIGVAQISDQVEIGRLIVMFIIGWIAGRANSEKLYITQKE
nr:hypothetical protein [Plesiomonas shigelloides]